jgi:hypothetical protein
MGAMDPVLPAVNGSRTMDEDIVCPTTPLSDCKSSTDPDCTMAVAITLVEACNFLLGDNIKTPAEQYCSDKAHSKLCWTEDLADSGKRIDSRYATLAHFLPNLYCDRRRDLRY